jgi:hypothetical protein
MSITPMLRGRRLAANGLIVLVVAAGAGAGVALANGGGGKNGGTLTDTSTTKAAPATNGEVPHQFIDAVQALVANGTISQSQADTIEAQVRTGGMDSEQFVQSGLLTQAQMDAVNGALRTVKTGLAQGAGGTAGSGSDKSPGGDVEQRFIAAVQSRVTDGTISQAQADTIEDQIRAGSVDSQQLIDAGVVTAAQMQAVGDSLKAVKQSIAGG